MSSSEVQLREEIVKLQELRDQARAAVNNVLQLLEKADQRRRHEVASRWDRIVDNLERTLNLARARLTTYEQQVKECERALADLAATGEPAALAEAGEDALPGELLAGDVPVPKDHLRVAERILGIPLEELGRLTLDQVAEMNSQLFEEPEEEPEKPASQPEAAAPSRRLQLDARIEHAKQTRETLAAASRRTQPSFAERRRQKLLRDGIAKATLGNFGELGLEEVELVIEYHASLANRSDKTPSDVRLQSVLDFILGGLQNRASELRRRRAQQYLRKKP